MKKVISLLLICALLAGCSSHQEPADGSVIEVSADSSGGAGAASSTSSETSSSKESSASSTNAVPEESSGAESSSKEVSSAESTSSGVDSTVSQEPSPASSATVSEPEPVPVIQEPTWSERIVDGSMYVNTNGIYSRKTAIVGSEAVKRYSVNDKVNVVALTTTDYYKLEDGTFIHKDYLSDKETNVTPSAPTAPASSSAEKLLNSAPLNPMKTNNDELDEQVAALLGRITNDGMSTYQKTVAVYDYFIKNYTYGSPGGGYTFYRDYRSSSDFMAVLNARPLIETGVGVCDNYAALFMIIMRRIGLESYVVGGQISSRGGGTTGHAWPLIKLDGVYYIFDAQIEQSNSSNGWIGYNWFCKSDTSMSGIYTYDTPRDNMIAAFGNFEPGEEFDMPQTIYFGGITVID